jgi:hypothetical protein
MQGILGTTASPGTAAWSSAVDAWIASHPGKTLSSFGLSSDSIFQGRTPDPNSTYPDIQNNNFISMQMIADGGFSLYKGLQMSLKGRVSQEGYFHGLVRDGSYQISYALGSSQATNGAYRTEFLNSAHDKHNPADPVYFGYVPEDHRHMLTAGVNVGTFLGFRLSPLVKFYTAGPGTLSIPQLGLTGSNAMFSVDESGSGYTGTNPVPGTHVGSFGRDQNSWAAVNQVLTAYNSNYAGKPDPAGQALITAGLLSASQLNTLKGVYPTIPLVPTTNPWPFQNFFNMDLGLSRPVKLTKIREGMDVEPWIQFFNVFNNNSLNSYGGLGTTFGTLNYAYQPSDIVTLAQQRGRQNGTRLFQIGVRVNF